MNDGRLRPSYAPALLGLLPSGVQGISALGHRAWISGKTPSPGARMAIIITRIWQEGSSERNVSPMCANGNHFHWRTEIRMCDTRRPAWDRALMARRQVGGRKRCAHPANWLRWLASCQARLLYFFALSFRLDA